MPADQPPGRLDVAARPAGPRTHEPAASPAAGGGETAGRE
jgi:hypothetical protein